MRKNTAVFISVALIFITSLMLLSSTVKTLYAIDPTYYYRDLAPDPSAVTTYSYQLNETAGNEGKEFELNSTSGSVNWYYTTGPINYKAGTWTVYQDQLKARGPRVTFDLYIERTNLNGSVVIQQISHWTHTETSGSYPNEVSWSNSSVPVVSVGSDERIRVRVTWAGDANLKIGYNGPVGGNYDSRLTTPTVVALPIASFTHSPVTPLVNQIVTFDASASYDPDASVPPGITWYYWDFGDTTTLNTTNPIVTHVYNINGTRNVTLIVADAEGLTDSTTKSLKVTLPPVADFTWSPTTPYTSETVTFDATASYDPDGYIVSWDWNFGDTSTGTDNITTHAYVDDGTYTVSLTVTDNDGATNSTSKSITVLNRDPVATFTESATTVYTGETITFNATESHDLDGSITLYTWDFGDLNVTSTIDPIITHAYDDDGIYTVTLTVTDDDGAVSAPVQDTKNVLNRPPVADADGPYSGYEGSLITLDASASTDIDGTIVLYEWDWDNDGSYDENTAQPTIDHTWGDDFSGTVGLRVTDDDGATDTATVSVTVGNVAPVVDAGFDQAVDEGSTVSFSGGFTDPGWLDTHTVHWDFGDGGFADGTLTPMHAYGDNGVYPVTLTVTDDDSGIGVDTLSVTVSNVAPAANAGSDQTVNKGETVSFSGSSIDPGWLDTLDYAWDFDASDGIQVDAIGQDVSNVYPSSGNYVVTLTVTDDDGGVGTDTLTVFVLELPHDVAVLDITVEYPWSATEAYPGWDINITVTVKNEGTESETFWVAVYYNLTVTEWVMIGNETLTDLAAGANQTLTFVWDTTGVPPSVIGDRYTIYTFNATANTVPFEVDTVDNVLVEGAVWLKLPGDANGDGSVGILDAGLVSAHWYPGPPIGPFGYDPVADFNGDGKADIVDAAILSANWGKTIGP